MEKIKDKLHLLKIADYYRKSSRSDDRQALSLDGQTEEADKARKLFGIPKPIATYKESRSAKFANKRTFFTEMADKILKGEINCIFAWHLNRIARNMTEGGLLIDQMSEGKLTVITFCDGKLEVYDESSDMGVVAQMFGASKQYSLALSKDVKRGHRTKAEKKGLPANQARIGYCNSKQGEKGERWWYVDEERFWKMKKVFEKMLTGRFSIGKLLKYANEELQLTTPKHKNTGGKPLHKGYLAKKLHDPIYAGFFYVQGERYSLDPNLPRMITESEHKKIKQILSNRFNGKVQSHEAVYSGFIKSDTGDFISQDVKYQLWCDCGHKFAYRDKKSCPKCNKKIDELDNPEYFIQSYYYNNRKKKNGLSYASVREDKITEELTKYISENIQLPTPLLDWAKKYIHEVKDQEIIDGLNKNNDLEKRKLKYEESKKRATKLFIEGSISEEEKKTFLSDLESEYSDLKKENQIEINWLEKLDEIIDLTKEVKEVFLNSSYEAKRNILTRLGANITWNDKELFINNRKSINILISGIKSISPYLEGFGNDKTLVLQGENAQNEQVRLLLRAR